MFKVAPRYLSGVSVFYGDDISRRELDGELVIFVGPATKGPSVPVKLQNIDSAVALYGSDNPLVKAIYEFYDGYLDSGRNTNLKIVTFRVGGIPASISTSYGLSLQTTDAYNGIENDYFIYVNDASESTSRVKIWDKNALLVFDSSTNINTGHFIVNTLPTGESGKIYGIDIDADPLSTPVTLSRIVNLDIITPGGSALSPSALITVGTKTITVDEDITLYPSSGTIKISEVTGAITKSEFVKYTSLDASTKTFTLASETVNAYTTSADISLVGTIAISSDSETNISNRVLYEKFRNALLDVEMYTPDYIVPAGVTYNATEKYNKVYNESTLLKQSLTESSTYAIVEAAGNWPSTGVIDLFSGGNSHNFMKYSAITVLGEDYRIALETPSYDITNGATNGSTSITVSQQVGGAPVSDLLTTGYVKIGDTIHSYTVADPSMPEVLTIDPSISIEGSTTLQKVPGTQLANSTIVYTTFSKLEPFELGIGYVKETDEGDKITFEWSDTKLAGYGLAHFGYLFANFCNKAAVGYNTPLCGMNVELPLSYDRASLVSWVGKLPRFKVRVDNQEAVEAVVMNGTGLLGEATMAGSVNYNRVYMSNFDAGIFADPAFGLLMTDEGFVDGHEIKDSYNNVVDLGKYMIVGAGIITFANRGSSKQYKDSCGIYALGLLAGKPQGEGISFSRIGVGSNASISVVVNRNLYNDLASLGYIVVTREKGLGWVINNSHSACRNDSSYYLISTTRTVKYVIEEKRSILVNFIGKPVNTLTYESARTRLAESFTADVRKGLLMTTPIWDLEVVQAGKAIGKFVLRCKLNPALELTQVEIDAAIERENIIQ